MGSGLYESHFIDLLGQALVPERSAHVRGMCMQQFLYDTRILRNENDLRETQLSSIRSLQFDGQLRLNRNKN